ncbi:fungal-specific transcription factor domain-containing protein [Fennellomyces sp. T-0311]|nr:fungal-specific transcription factor domain-containing protein [Fennellomyces sp. T-0311]
MATHPAMEGKGRSNDGDFYPSMDIVMHLVDLFFKNLNSVFPLVHRRTLKQSIQNGTVSKPLLWSVMGIGARFSDHPSIRADPPYWAGERFAIKATSLIDATMLEPTIPNLQFWGIMACLEYGRASGSRAWIYGGLAVRICQELGLNREETLSSPILKKDGSVDTAAMALRRRIFWSCYCLDKFASAGTSRPQYFDASDCDSTLPTVTESVLLRDLFQCTSIEGKELANDSLMDVTRHYLRMVMIFGESTKFMTRAKSDSESVNWPPVPEFNNLDARLRSWKSDLPERFQFSVNNLNMHRRSASRNYLTLWLSTHAVWCTTMMVLHRGSLAYSEVSPSEVPEDLYRRIQASINSCRVSIDEAMVLFKALRDLVGPNVLPFMGYSAYICATVLMTSTFSKDAESFKKSSNALKVLYSMIDGLAPFWPMCERLALTTRDLLLTHSRLYDTQYRQDYYTEPVDAVSPSSQASAQRISATDSLASVESSVAAAITSDPTSKTSERRLEETPFGLVKGPSAQQHSALPLLQESFPLTTSSGEIDFNSSEFLYDSALFGQIMFDAAKPSTQSGPSMYMDEQPVFPTDILGANSSNANGASSTEHPTTLNGLVGNKPLWEQSP